MIGLFKLWWPLTVLGNLCSCFRSEVFASTTSRLGWSDSSEHLSLGAWGGCNQNKGVFDTPKQWSKHVQSHIWVSFWIIYDYLDISVSYNYMTLKRVLESLPLSETETGGRSVSTAKPLFPIGWFCFRDAPNKSSYRWLSCCFHPRCNYCSTWQAGRHDWPQKFKCRNVMHGTSAHPNRDVWTFGCKRSTHQIETHP